MDDSPHGICYSLYYELKKGGALKYYCDLVIQEAFIIHLPSANRQLVGTERLGNRTGISFRTLHVIVVGRLMH